MMDAWSLLCSNPSGHVQVWLHSLILLMDSVVIVYLWTGLRGVFRRAWHHRTSAPTSFLVQCFSLATWKQCVWYIDTPIVWWSLYVEECVFHMYGTSVFVTWLNNDVAEARRCSRQCVICDVMKGMGMCIDTSLFARTLTISWTRC